MIRPHDRWNWPVHPSKKRKRDSGLLIARLARQPIQERFIHFEEYEIVHLGRFLPRTLLGCVREKSGADEDFRHGTSVARSPMPPRDRGNRIATSRWALRHERLCRALSDWGAHDDQVDAMTQALLRWNMIPRQLVFSVSEYEYEQYSRISFI
jgi:hypothetical protein